MTNRWMPRSPDNRFLETTVYRADFVPTPIHRVPKPSWHWPGHIPSAETTSSYEDAFSRNKEYARVRSSHDYSRRRTHVSPHLRFAEKTTNQVELRSFVCSSPYPPHWFLLVMQSYQEASVSYPRVPTLSHAPPHPGLAESPLEAKTTYGTSYSRPVTSFGASAMSAPAGSPRLVRGSTRGLTIDVIWCGAELWFTIWFAERSIYPIHGLTRKPEHKGVVLGFGT